VIVTLPVEMPDATPEAEPMVAIDVLLLLHVPPLVALLKVEVAPVQTVKAPVIADGNAFTVTILVAVHPFTLYVIVAVPALTPVTMPVEEPTVALAVLLLLHAPPAKVFVSVVVAPAHMVAVPLIDAGRAFTVTVTDSSSLPQLFVTVYIMSVMPASTAVTIPVLLTVAVLLSSLFHVPPLTELLKVVVAPSHTLALPVIKPAVGIAVTVATLVAIAVPQLLVTAYDIVALPPESPVTFPSSSTYAMVSSLLLHTPPVVALLNTVRLSSHTVAVPVIVPALGKGFTVTTVVATQLPIAYDIVAVPVATPVTTPDAFTVALLVALLLHTPPLTVFPRLVVADTHTVVVPVMEVLGALFIVTILVATVPQLVEYDIVHVPAVRPLTTPAALTVALAVLLLLHVPNATLLLNVVVSPAQTLVVPVIVPGVVLIVTTAVAEQVPALYVIVAVPARFPVTTPVVAFTLAIRKLLLLQLPPLVALLNVEELPVQNDNTPEIASGAEFTVIVLVAAVPQPVEYVIVHVPAPTPVTTPSALTVARSTLLLLQVPFAVRLPNVSVCPVHTLELPDIANGVVATFTVAVW
jgi:hypothetical protein